MAVIRSLFRSYLSFSFAQRVEYFLLKFSPEPRLFEIARAKKTDIKLTLWKVRMKQQRKRNGTLEYKRKKMKMGRGKEA